MSTTNGFSRVGRAAVLAVLAVAVAACGGHGWHHVEPYGTLEVENDPFSFEDLEAVELWQGYGPIDHYDLWLAPGDVDWIDLVPGLYDMDLLWSDGWVDTLYDVEIVDGWVTTVTGFN
jgi:hypothetical protein